MSLSCNSLSFLSPAGAPPSGRIGEDPKGRPGNLLPLLAQMAGGRVKDSTLKVFGNDYPTMYVSVLANTLSRYNFDFLVMELAFGITFTCWTWPLDISWLWKL